MANVSSIIKHRCTVFTNTQALLGQANAHNNTDPGNDKQRNFMMFVATRPPLSSAVVTATSYACQIMHICVLPLNM